MIRTVEAIIDETGEITLSQPVAIKGLHRVLVTILEEPPTESVETALLSEQALSVDWTNPEEDEAWSHLQ